MPRLGSRVRIPSSAPFFCLSNFPLSSQKSSHSLYFLRHPSRERTQLHIQSHFKLDLPVCQMRPFAAKRGQSEWSYSGHAFCTFCTDKASKYSPSPLFRSVYGAFAECGHPRGHASGHAHIGLPMGPFLKSCNIAQRCTFHVGTKSLLNSVARLVPYTFHGRALLPRFDSVFISVLTFIMLAEASDRGSCLAIPSYAILFLRNRQDCGRAQSRVEAVGVGQTHGHAYGHDGIAGGV